MNSSPGIASTRAYAEAPAILAELERSRMEAEPAAKVSEPVSMDSAAVANDNNNNQENKEEDLFALAVAVQTKPLPPVNQTAPAAKKTSASPSTNKLKLQSSPARLQSAINNGEFKSVLTLRRQELKMPLIKLRKQVITLQFIQILRQSTSKFG